MTPDAVVLAGGQGLRLRPLTLTTPKPLLPVAGVPFLAHPLSRLRVAGVRHVVLAASRRTGPFEAAFGDGSALGLELDYTAEPTPLGTGGGIRHAAARVRTDTVLVLNGDLLCGLDFAALLAAHAARAADVTLFLIRVPDSGAYGSVTVDADQRVRAFQEKAAGSGGLGGLGDLVNGGCYVFARAVLDQIPAGREVSVEREVFPGLIAAGARVYGHVAAPYWRDLGTPAAFVRGSADLVRGIAPTAALPGPPGEYLVLDGATVAPTAVLSGGTTVGQRCAVGDHARVSGSVLFDGARVGPGAVVTRSVLGTGARVGTGGVITDAVLA